MTESVQQNMDFTGALTWLWAGARVARTGWNSKNMWLRHVPAEDWSLDGVKFVEELGFRRLPWIGMRTADGKFVPWLASQTDILAEDWWLIPPQELKPMSPT